jgi:hypothetical protein
LPEAAATVDIENNSWTFREVRVTLRSGSDCDEDEVHEEEVEDEPIREWGRPPPPPAVVDDESSGMAETRWSE